VSFVRYYGNIYHNYIYLVLFFSSDGREVHISLQSHSSPRWANELVGLVRHSQVGVCMYIFELSLTVVFNFAHYWAMWYFVFKHTFDPSFVVFVFRTTLNYIFLPWLVVTIFIMFVCLIFSFWATSNYFLCLGW